MASGKRSVRGAPAGGRNAGKDRGFSTVFHLDLKTAHYRPEYLKALFPRLARLGYSGILFEIENKVRLDSIADAVWHEAYSKEEFSEILSSARAAGLDPVPMIPTLGHLEFLLSHAKYHRYREIPETACQLCPSNPGSRKFLSRWIDEVAELFGDISLFLIGADEAYSLGACPSCAEFVRRESVSSLLLGHVDFLARQILSKGIRPIAWADMALKHPEALDKISRDLIWVDWDYCCGDGEGIWNNADMLAAKGFTTWIAPGSRSHGDSCLMPRFEHLPNVAGAAARMSKPSPPSGFLLTSWAVRLNHLEAQWPLIIAPGLAWEKGCSTAEELLVPLSEEWLGVEFPELGTLWRQLGATLPHMHSHLGENAACGLHIPMDRLDLLVRHWLDVAFPYWGKISAGEARHFTENFRAGYLEASRLLGTIRGMTSAPGLEFWSFAARAQEIKARELLLAMDAAAGGRADRGSAGKLMMEMEELQDEYRKMLSAICTPASVWREIDIIFSSGRRFLADVTA